MKTASNRLRQVLSLFSALDGLSDGELLARFLAGQDELAFARLVRVHGTVQACVARVAPVRTGGWLVTCTMREPLQAEEVEAFLLQGWSPVPIGA
jgi:hypothetical protein